jgi:hypothetical protein
MKKLSILSLVALVAIFLFASCNKYEVKNAEIKTQVDSLNYALGLVYGHGLKTYYMQKDSSDQAIGSFISAMDDAQKVSSKDEMYKLGLQIGNSIKQQKSMGLMNDSTLTFDSKLVYQGLVNGMKGFKEGMTNDQAKAYIEKTMAKIQEAKMSKTPTPASAPQTEQPATEATPAPKNQ